MIEPSVIQIGNVLVSSAIITGHFACDYTKCHGVCCVLGESGAPLLEEECNILKNEFSRFSKYLTKEGILSVSEQGAFVIDCDGDKVTPLVNGEECAYAVFDKNINAFCALEIAHREGACSIRKPVSCWLYPIRETTLSSGLTALNLHQWDICLDSFVKGKSEGIPLLSFVKDALIFRFGEIFFRQLEIARDELFK